MEGISHYSKCNNCNNDKCKDGSHYMELCLSQNGKFNSMETPKENQEESESKNHKYYVKFYRNMPLVTSEKRGSVYADSMKEASEEIKKMYPNIIKLSIDGISFIA